MTQETEKTKGLETKYVVAILMSLIIGGSIIVYGYLDYKAKQEALNQQLYNSLSKQMQTSEKQKQLQSCLDEVNSRLTGVFKDQKNITYRDVELVLDINEKQKAECFKKYPQD